MFYKKIYIIIAALFVAFFIYSAGFYIGKYKADPWYASGGLEYSKNAEQNTPPVDYMIFEDAWHAIEDRYVGKKDLNRQNMVYGAIAGMVRSLGDPYTAFFPPEEAALLESDIEGSFGGIGAEIAFKKNQLTIVAPLKDSPAQKAGLLAGDSVIAIDTIITNDITLEQAVSKIRGEPNTQVTLTIFRDTLETPKDFVITREIIKIPILEWEKKENNIAHIKLSHFIGSIDTEFETVVGEIQKQGIQKIILDLRNNPGGFLDSAIRIASYFIPRGGLIVTQDSRNGQKEDFRSTGYPAIQNIPVVVLIDGGSASASEIVAGAMKGMPHVTLVGEKTFGKGSVQELIELSHKTLVKVTVAEWLTPSGVSIQDSGIEPDISIILTPEEKEGKRDILLEKALEILK